MYKIPAQPSRTEEIIQRSKFIATVAHASNKQAVKTFLSEIKKEFPDATHHCWAYVAGPPGETARIGMSDDKEPHGTAGRPILAVLLHSGVGEIVAVVTRYFGGIKLGTGGLVRAYSGCVKNALDRLSVTEKRDLFSLTLVFTYEKMAAVKQMIEAFDSDIVEETYAGEVSFTIELPKTNRDRFIRAMRDTTGGKIRFM